MLCHVAVLVGLVMIGWRHFGDVTAGIGSATLYVLLPYTAYNIGQVHHVWPTAFVVWAVFCYRRVAGGVAVGPRGGHVGVPGAAVPLWLGFYSRRGATRFGFSFLAALVVSVGVTALVLWIDGPTGWNLVSALHLTDWKPWSALGSASKHLDGLALGVPDSGVRAVRGVPHQRAGVPSPKNLSTSCRNRRRY